MGRFNYWKRNHHVRSLKIKLPSKANKPLVFYQIAKGCFDESPYWEQSLKEKALYLAEVEKYRQNNPSASEASVEASMQPRRTSYNKRIRKLQEAHIDYEDTRLAALRQGLTAAFKQDLWEELTPKCAGGPKELYQLYEERNRLNYI